MVGPAEMGGVAKNPARPISSWGSSGKKQFLSAALQIVGAQGTAVLLATTIARCQDRWPHLRMTRVEDRNGQGLRSRLRGLAVRRATPRSSSRSSYARASSKPASGDWSRSAAHRSGAGTRRETRRERALRAHSSRRTGAGKVGNSVWGQDDTVLGGGWLTGFRQAVEHRGMAGKRPWSCCDEAVESPTARGRGKCPMASDH